MTVAVSRRLVETEEDDDLYPSGDGKPMAESHQHLLQMFYNVETLTNHFADQSDVYVCGNHFIYFERGNPKAVVAPDCYVVFHSDKRLRDSYKLWEENGKVPNLIIEVTCKSTKREDERKKQPLYARLGVQEYFRHDPRGDYLKPRLQGGRLENGEYVPIPMLEEGRLYSEVLGLDLVLVEDKLRFYDPKTQKYLLSYEEQAQQLAAETQRAEAEAQKAEIEAQRAEEEAAARQAAESEIERLRAEIENLRRQK